MGAKKLDTKVMEMRDKLLAKKAELAKADKPTYIAGEMFRPSTYTQRGEFRVLTASSAQLLEGLMSLLHRKQAAEMLEMGPSHIGFPIEDWITDFKTRKNVLDKNQKETEVRTLEAKLRPLLTPVQLREIGIADLESEIEGL